MSEQPAVVHPIVGFGVRVHEVLDGLVPVAAWSMTAQEQRDTLVALARAEARIVELRLRVLVEADRSHVAADSAAVSTVAWVAQHTRQGRGAAAADLRLARSLESGCAVTRAALAVGELEVAQARVIVAAVEALPAGVSEDVRRRAEQHLVALAGEHDAARLKVLGRRVFEVVDPDAADVEEGRRLERAEAAAQRACFLHLFDNGDGTHTGRFKLPSLHAVLLRKMLHAILAPRRQRQAPNRQAEAGQAEAGQAPDDERAPAGRGITDTQQTDQTRNRPEQMGAALCDLLERFPASGLPRAGGVSATVLVLIDYEKLLSGLGAGQLDTGEPISAGLARRLACQGGVVPAVYQQVLGGPSAVLDLGRRRRFHTSSQRIAMTIRDRGCTAEGCDRPAGWCEAHHDQTSWADGGGTSVAQGRLLCAFHHGKAHSPRYRMTRLPTGAVAFHRRT